MSVPHVRVACDTGKVQVLFISKYLVPGPFAAHATTQIGLHSQPAAGKQKLGEAEGCLWPWNCCWTMRRVTRHLLLLFCVALCGGNASTSPSREGAKSTGTYVLPRAWARRLYCATSINPLLAVAFNDYTSHIRMPLVTNALHLKGPRNLAKTYGTLFYFARLKPRVAFTIGGMLRALQVQTGCSAPHSDHRRHAPSTTRPSATTTTLHHFPLSQ